MPHDTGNKAAICVNETGRNIHLQQRWRGQQWDYFGKSAQLLGNYLAGNGRKRKTMRKGKTNTRRPGIARAHPFQLTGAHALLHVPIPLLLCNWARRRCGTADTNICESIHFWPIHRLSLALCKIEKCARGSYLTTTIGSGNNKIANVPNVRPGHPPAPLLFRPAQKGVSRKRFPTP